MSDISEFLEFTWYQQIWYYEQIDNQQDCYVWHTEQCRQCALRCCPSQAYINDQEINDKLKASSDNSSFDTAKDFKLYREDEDPKHEDYEKGLQTPRLLLSLQMKLKMACMMNCS